MTDSHTATSTRSGQPAIQLSVGTTRIGGAKVEEIGRCSRSCDDVRPARRDDASTTARHPEGRAMRRAAARRRHRGAAQGDHGDRCRLLRLGGDERCRCVWCVRCRLRREVRKGIGVRVWQGRHCPTIRSASAEWSRNGSPRSARHRGSGDFGFTVGSAGARVVDPSAPPHNTATAGHYFTIWRRDATGRWRWVID